MRDYKTQEDKLTMLGNEDQNDNKNTNNKVFVNLS